MRLKESHRPCGRQGDLCIGRRAGDTVSLMLTKNKRLGRRPCATNQPTFARQAAAILPALRHLRRMQMADAAMPQQLRYKQQEAEQNLRRIGKVDIPEILPIIGPIQTPVTATNWNSRSATKRYLSREEIGTTGAITQENALGYHAPGSLIK